MPGVALARRRFNPGTRARLNPSHPLAAGLVFFQSSGTGVGRAGGTGISWGQSPYGKAIQSSNNTSAFAMHAPKMPTMHNWTVHSVIKQSSANAWACCGGLPANPQNTSWVSPYWAIFAAKDFDKTEPGWGQNNAGTYQLVVQATANVILFTDNQWHSYTHSCGTLGAIVYRDGVQRATTATTPFGTGTAMSPSITGTPETVWCGRSASAPTDEGYTGVSILQALWSRRLDAKEAAMLHDDPFQMFLL